MELLRRLENHRHAKRDAKVEMLAAVPLFSGCTPRQLTELAHLFEISFVKPGEILLSEGAHDRCLSVIADGVAVVSECAIAMGLLTGGEYFGERSVMGEEVSAVSVVALTPMVIFTLHRRMFPALSMRLPMVTARLSDLAGRPAPYEQRSAPVPA